MQIHNKEKCTGCGKCTSVCPQGAISLVNKIAVIDYNNCIECGICSRTCPHQAIYAGDESDQQILQDQNAGFLSPGIGQGRGLGMGRGRGLGRGPRDGCGRGRGGGGRRR
ncbi:MAG: 4Fe-4S binding protein [Spirochaetales bacterium]|nr:4Fe-4S binding protein [Spirochaetales bacterium]